MAHPTLEVADIIRAYQEKFEASRSGNISGAERRVLTAITSCRTASLGGHVDQCDRCDHNFISYNSCRNRHCPKCQESARAEWLSDREQDLLPVEYFHVVFTVPHEIAAIALQNKKIVYEILFRACAETVIQVAADPRHLGATVGLLAVLHTWGQTLEHHPHVHCVIPGGGIAPDSSRWIPCRPGFFLPVRILSRLFRGKFLHHLFEAFQSGRLAFHGELHLLSEHSAFRAYLAPLYKKDWFVYSKEPFGGPAHVLKYLARYTHRVAISNNRLISMENGNVTFSWKDYANNCRRRSITLTSVEFLRRFLLHILPKGFVRIRNYGFLANRNRRKKIALCRSLLAQPEKLSDLPGALVCEDIDPKAKQKRKCPACKLGTLICVMVFECGSSLSELQISPSHDTS